MKIQECKICSFKSDLHKRVIAKEMMFGMKDEFNYFECINCQCLQIEVLPTNIAHYYPNNYYSLNKTEGKRFRGFKGAYYRFRNNASFFRNNFFFKILHFFSPIIKLQSFHNLGITTKSRVLDVGCGSGDFFIYPFKEMGFTDVIGCDPFINEDITYENGLHVYKTNVFGMKGKWDLIIYNHSFEHLPDPFENLVKVNELLSDNGICLIRTPTLPCQAWEKYGVNWFQLDAPRHFYIQSPASLKLMCDKAGFAIERITYDSTCYQFLASEGYSKGIPLVAQKHTGSISKKLKKIRLNLLAQKLNKLGLGDQAVFILRKNGVTKI
jgi:SAM-dependent methyltransferase